MKHVILVAAAVFTFGASCVTKVKAAECNAQCIALTKANEKMNAYLETAANRLKPISLRGEQDAWEAYRITMCGNVYLFWREGSIRFSKVDQCLADLAAQRTYDIWQNYLTFPDSAKPLLPRP